VTPVSPSNSDRPRLRRDLEFTHRQHGETTEVIVCDPVGGRYFRAGELEAALFALLDGETPLAEITGRLVREFPDLPEEEVPAFVAELDRMGFLEGSAAVGARPRPPLYRRLLYAQMPLANPDPWLARLVRYIGWLYRPSGWVAVGLLFLVAGIVAATSGEELARQATPTGEAYYWVRLWIGLSIVSTIHEFGHGLTCRYFGGRTAGMGLLWMYGLPCFYCDVSGAWMLSRKSERIWVGAAGLYYQFIAGAAALLLWRVLEPASVASDLLLAMATSCGLLSLLNLNPLLKLDGYYLLSDALEMPNLRQRAFDYLGARLSRFWFGERAEPVEETSAREARVFLAYTLLTALFLAWLLSRVLWNVGSGLTGRLGGTGALLFLALVSVSLGAPIAKSAAAGARRLGHWKELPAMARRRWVIAGVGAAVVLLLLAAAPWELNLTSPCKLDAAVRGALRARTQGRVAELSAREGTRVRRGEVIGHLATFEREQRRAERQAQLRTLRMEIAALSDRLPIVEAETAQATAEAETGAQEARTRLAEEREAQPARVAEAQRRAEAARADLLAATGRLDEARAAVEAQSRIAGRQRADADRAARGENPPALAAAREQWRLRVAERDLARQEYERVRLLVADSALAPQQLDAARTANETAARRAEEALQALTARAKELREAADDAEAELARRRAALEAQRADEASARAKEEAAREAARLVSATSRPARIETARLRAESGRASLAAARASRRELLARRSEIHAKRQNAERIAAQIAILNDQIRRSALRAPCNGIVTTPRVEERIGAHFDEGDTILEVEDPRALHTRIFLNEKELGDVRAGQPVLLRVAAYPDRLYRGKVSEIAPRAVPGGSAQFPTNIVEVRLRVENAGGELRPGMSGWAKIRCGRRPLGTVLLRRVNRYLRSEVWSWF
jgi:putative peptide zinc metalloprotease protein